MKPASCFGDLASFSNRQKRLQQNRRYAVDIHNDDFRTRLLVVLLAKPTNVVLCSRQQIQFRWYLYPRETLSWLPRRIFPNIWWEHVFRNGVLVPRRRDAVGQ